MNTAQPWQRYKHYICRDAPLGLTLDVSRMGFDDGFVDRMAQPMQRAFEAIDALE